MIVKIIKIMLMMRIFLIIVTATTNEMRPTSMKCEAMGEIN